jgi:hypothetical protein
MSFPGDAIDNVDLKAITAGGLVNEDVAARIFQLSFLETPFQDLIGTDSCNQDYTEWVSDELGSPSTSKYRVSGSDASSYETATGARVGNITQINARTIAVSERAQNSSTIGRGNELAYQTMLAMQRVRQDVEAHVTSHQASVADDNVSTAGKAGGFSAFIATNDALGVGGSSGGFNTTTKIVDAPTVGVGRALAWVSMIGAQVLNVFNAYGNVRYLMTTPTLVNGINAKLVDGTIKATAAHANIPGDGGRAIPQTAQAYFQVIITAFGTSLTIVPNRLMQTYTGGGTSSNVTSNVDVLGIDPERAAMAYLDGYKVKDLAKNGLSDRRDITVDWTLKVYNEKAHFVIRDINPASTVLA